MQRSKIFISPSVLFASRQSIIPIDATWFMPNVPRNAFEEYKKTRIPNAGFFNLDVVSDTTSPFPHMLPSVSTFKTEMGKLGITKHNHLCIYDTHGLFSAARVWWTFRVFGHTGQLSILEGGLPSYLAAGLPTTSHDPTNVYEPVEYGTPEFQPDLVADFAQVKQIANQTTGSKDVQILDARPNPRFTGAAPEPRPGLSSGHIPHSISLPFSKVQNQDGSILEPDALRQLLQEEGVNLSKPIVVSCGTGVTACILNVALQQLGVEAKVYDESWTGYADDSRAGKLDGMIVKT